MKRNRTFVAILLTLLALAGCTTTPPPTTRITAPTATPAASPTPGPSPTPTPTPPPPAPLGLVRLWRADTQDSVWSIGATDVEGDGRPEVGAASYDHRFYLLDAAGGERWSFATAAPLFTFLAADLDGDGRPEFLLGGDDNAIYAVSGEGTLRWSYPTSGRVTHLAAGDVDGDGQVELLAATWDGALHILDSQGALKERLALEGRPSVLITADLDADGALEILAGTEGGRLVAQEASGQVLWQHSMEGAVRGLLSVDVDRNRQNEVVVGSQSGVVALLSADGAPRWAQRVSGNVVALMAVPLESLVLVGTSGGVAALRADSGLPAWEKGTAQGVWSFAVLGSAEEPVLVAGTDGGEILLLNRRGQLRGETKLPSRVHGLVAADLDGDGRPELVARSGDYVYAFRLASEGEPGEAAPFVPTLFRWPTPSPLPPLPEGRISLAAVGDVMLSRSIEERMQGYGASYPFDALAFLLSQADIAVGNLECVLSQGGEPADKPYVFRAHPDTAAGLAAAGFDLLTLANNHTLDYGTAGLAETLAALQSQGIRPVGAGGAAGAPVVLEVRGIRVAFLARNTVGYPQEGLAWVEDEEQLRQDVRQARGQADVLVLLLHGGDEYSADTSAEQRRLAQAAVEAGADLVIGHHSHVVQGTERYGDGFIAYGLGDFVFDIDIVDAARDGAVLWVVLSREGVVQATWIPTRIVDDVQPRPVQGYDGQVAVRPLFAEVSEPIPAPPSPRSTYRLWATVDPAAGSVYVQEQLGFLNASADSLSDLALFVFPNAYPGAFSLGAVRAARGGQAFFPSYALSETTLRIFLPQPLPPGDSLTLTLGFTLTPPLLDPLAWPPEGNLGRTGDGRVFVLGHWYPQLVPYQGGAGWQTWSYHPVGDPFFADLADYRIELTAPAAYTVVGSGERVQEGEHWRFRLDAVRDFALLVGRDYEEAVGEADGIAVISAYRREHAAAGRAVLQDVQRAIALFQDCYGPYPYRTFVVVEGDMNGGMEYGGMVLVGSPFYEGYSGGPEAVLPSLAVHELAHQWWYGVVGNDQVHEPWLDEALARYSELVFYQAVYPDSVGWWWQNRVDQWNPSGPLDVSIYDYSDTSTYVHNLYGRAAHFMQELRDRVGDEAFFTFLQRYYREYAWQRVNRSDFFGLLGQVSDERVDDLVRAYFQK